MVSYNVRDVERVLQLSRSTIRGLIEVGFVKPERGPRREYRFSFRDLIVLRAARALIHAKLPRKRIRRSLEELRRHLPETMPMSGLSICAVGDRVVVRDGGTHWQADDGQYLLGLDVVLENGMLHMIERTATASVTQEVPQPSDSRSADEWFDEALELEVNDPAAAGAAYEQAIGLDPQYLAAWINWGRLLHEQGATREADKVYARALQECGPDSLLLFNRGVLLEDVGKAALALEAYHAAIEADPKLADCHYNLARLYEVMGKPQHAIRHLGQYRRLMSSSGH
ncbi:MAG: tetratricopeptide repeat protein [Sinobacteraceae bacterium]|nr:tetratricopeptide repeat protein [Nevskiaceae bacterium]